MHDPLAVADVIAVLNGGVNCERAAKEVLLYKAGYAPRILMSGNTT